MPNYVPKTGGQFTGPVYGHDTNHEHDLELVTKKYVDDGDGGEGGGGGDADHTHVDNEVPSGAINGSNVTFTLENAPDPSNSLHLFYNGLRLKPGAGFDYTLSGDTITMNEAPLNGGWLLADYRM